MNLHLSRHVFGCRQGYRTLAGSSDLTRGEREELESFSFGQTNAPGYLETLDHNPAYWCRRLTSGRWAVTRVFRGALDENGRSTLLFVSAVLKAADWVHGLSADASPLLRATTIWTWDGQSRLPPLRIAIERPAAPPPDDAQRARVLSMLALVEVAHGAANETIVASELEFSPDDVRLLATLLPRASKGSFSYSVRSLSDGLPVNVNCLAGDASRGKSTRRTSRWSPSASYDQPTYTAALAFFWQPGQPPPWEFVANCETFGEETWELSGVRPTLHRSAEKPGSPPAGAYPPTRRPRWSSGYVLLAACLLSLVGVTTSYIVLSKRAEQRMKHAQTAADGWVEEVTQFVGGFPTQKPLPPDKAKRTELIRRAEHFEAEASGLRLPPSTEEFERMRGVLKDWLREARLKHRNQTDVEERLEEFQAFASSNGMLRFSRRSRYPSHRLHQKVDSWEGTLKNQLVRSDQQMDGLYLSELSDALSTVSDWNRTREDLVEVFQDELRPIMDFLNSEPPETLGSRFGTEEGTELGKWQDKLRNLRARTQHLPARTDDQRIHALRDGLERADERIEKRRNELTRLRDKCKEALKEAKQISERSRIYLNDPHPDRIAVLWDEADQAWRHCKSALEIAPSDSECLKTAQGINDWIARISQAAHENFKSLVDEADAEWEQERRVSTTKPADDERTEAQGPNPSFALQLVRRALDYYDQTYGAIDAYDQEKNEYERAVKLEDALESFRDQQRRDESDSER